MTTTRVHQLLPTFSPRDAVGNNTIELQRLLRSRGYESRVFASYIHPELTDAATPAVEYDEEDCWLIYHHSIGSIAGDVYERHVGPRLLVYHNITPLDLVERWAPEVGAEIMLGRDQTARFAPLTDVAVADSDYNRGELDALGYQRTLTIPVLFDPGRIPTSSSTRRDGAGARLLFVGRLAPNKAQHELVAALAVLRATSHPDATLHLVGSKTFGTYADALDDYIDELDLADAVVIHEGVSDEELAAHYASADVFVCVSDHEGFCVPLIEAMHHGLPVVAFDSSAVGGTVGSGGIVLRQKSPDLVAAAVRRVLGDQGLWSSMSAAGRARAADFDLGRSLGRWSALLDELIGADVAVAT